MISFKKTHRGFDRGNFSDLYGHECSIQKSSLASEDAIWFGVNNAEPKVLSNQAARLGVETSEQNAWVPFPIPEEVSLYTRMHLSREQVKALLPTLKRFVKTGDLQ